MSPDIFFRGGKQNFWRSPKNDPMITISESGSSAVPRYAATSCLSFHVGEVAAIQRRCLFSRYLKMILGDFLGFLDVGWWKFDFPSPKKLRTRTISWISSQRPGRFWGTTMEHHRFSERSPEFWMIPGLNHSPFATNNFYPTSWWSTFDQRGYFWDWFQSYLFPTGNQLTMKQVLQCFSICSTWL